MVKLFPCDVGGTYFRFWLYDDDSTGVGVLDHQLQGYVEALILQRVEAGYMLIRRQCLLQVTSLMLHVTSTLQQGVQLQVTTSANKGRRKRNK